MSLKVKGLWKALKIQGKNDLQGSVNNTEKKSPSERKQLSKYFKNVVGSSKVSSLKEKKSTETIIEKLLDESNEKQGNRGQEEVKIGKRKEKGIERLQILRRVRDMRERQEQMGKYLKLQVLRMKQFIRQEGQKIQQILKIFNQKLIFLQNKLSEEKERRCVVEEELHVSNQMHILYKEQSEREIQIKQNQIRELKEAPNLPKYSQIQRLQEENHNNQELIFDYRQQITKMSIDRKQYEDYVQKKYYNEAKKVYLVQIERLQEEVETISAKYNEIEKEKKLLNEREYDVQVKEEDICKREQDIQQNLLKLYSNIEELKQQHENFKIKEEGLLLMERKYKQEFAQLEKTKQYYEQAILMSKNNIRSIKSSHALNPNHNHNNGIMNGHINVHNNINSNLSNNSKLFSIHGDNFDKIKNQLFEKQKLKTQCIQREKPRERSKSKNQDRRRIVSGDTKMLSHVSPPKKPERMVRYQANPRSSQRPKSPQRPTSPKSPKEKSRDRERSTKRKYNFRSIFSGSNAGSLNMNLNSRLSKCSDQKLHTIDQKLQKLKGELRRQIKRAK